MASNKIIRFGPVALTTSVANLVNPPTLTGGTGLAGTNSNTYVILRKLNIVNTSSSAQTFSLYVGATGASAAGTEFGGKSYSIPANQTWTSPELLALEAADFLTGLGSANSALTFSAEGEIGVR